MLALMFPGQGAQSGGFDRDLFDNSPLFAALEPEIDRIAGFPVRDTCIGGTPDLLRRTEVTQPCLFVANALHHEAAVRAGARPDYLAGHSLGEFNALHAAGAFDLFSGLRMVVRRGALMASAPAGGMAAVLGLSPEAVERALDRAGLSEVDVANLNTPSQVVVAGPIRALAGIERAMVAAGASACIPLPVGAAFHSRLMAPAAAAFGAFLDEIALRPLRTPVIANVTGRPYPEGGDAHGTIRDLLVRQFASRVLWWSSVGFLRSVGVTQFREVGPGKILTRMVDEIPAPMDGARSGGPVG